MEKNGEKIKILDGKGGGGKSIKNPVKIVRSEVETKTKSKFKIKNQGGKEIF